MVPSATSPSVNASSTRSRELVRLYRRRKTIDALIRSLQAYEQGRHGGAAERRPRRHSAARLNAA